LLLKKIRRIAHFKVFLLLLYIFSNSPVDFFHQHQDEHVSFEDADGCEKSIYYSNVVDACHHSKHVSKTNEKCFICDHHTVSEHTFFNPINRKITQNVSNNVVLPLRFVNSQFLSLNAGRGPPRS